MNRIGSRVFPEMGMDMVCAVIEFGFDHFHGQAVAEMEHALSVPAVEVIVADDPVLEIVRVGMVFDNRIPVNHRDGIEIGTGIEEVGSLVFISLLSDRWLVSLRVLESSQW
jgi:hypothetical protein